jgi:hypothetical protein
VSVGRRAEQVELRRDRTLSFPLGD